MKKQEAFSKVPFSSEKHKRKKAEMLLSTFPPFGTAPSPPQINQRINRADYFLLTIAYYKTPNTRTSCNTQP